MKILLDHDLPKRLRLKFQGHLALTARQMGWDALSNGRLLAMAEVNGFDVLLTADQKMFSENSHLDRKVSLIVVSSSLMVHLEPMMEVLLLAVERAVPGSFEEIKIPLPPKVRKEYGGV